MGQMLVTVLIIFPREKEEMKAHLQSGLYTAEAQAVALSRRITLSLSSSALGLSFRVLAGAFRIACSSAAIRERQKEDSKLVQIEMALQHTIRLPYLFSSSTQTKLAVPISLHQVRTRRDVTRLHASSDKPDPYLMDSEERREWREKIRQVLDNNPDLQEELDPTEKTKKVQDLLANYPLVVDEEDPEWPEDADGRGFKLDQFFDKITIKNTPKKKDESDDDDESDDEIEWQDDEYIRPIKDVTTAEWEDTVFKDINPLIILVHNRYRRPKENEKMRSELEKAVQIIWNCRLPSPRCVAIDAVTEHDLVSALKVSVYPELIFTKAGKILYREKAIRSADELSKVMAFFYYGAAKPSCLNGIGDRQEDIPSVPINA